jgi:glycerol-3-phosphate dehydrogenase
MDRDGAWRALGDTSFDLLVIGGGINGAAIARDAALRGHRVALVDAEDWGAGTSSRSSRLIHGGVRYLEHGWLPLVFEASRERRLLLRLAPHLVHPLAFTWPIYRGARVPRWKLTAGLFLYDALALFRNVGTHQSFGADGARRLEPQLRTDGLTGGARYWDAQTSDTRLTFANALDAVRLGAVAVSHARVEALRHVDGRVGGAVVRDVLGDASTEVRARVVINAAGPWSDEIRRLDDPAVRAGVRGTKGVHVLVPRDRVGNRGALTLIAPQDGRVWFVLPWGAFTILGTTDTFDATPPAQVRATEADVAYLLDATNHHFPAARLTRADVRSAWAGLRPLVASASAGQPSNASREHELVRAASGLLSITGGKLTTYRAMAAQVVDAAERALGGPVRRCTTDQRPLPGGDLRSIDAELRAAAAAAGAEDIGRHWVALHGREWPAVHARVTAEPALGERLDPSLPYVWADVSHAIDAEGACTVGDVLIRRLSLAFERADQGFAFAPAIAARLVQARGGEVAAEVTRYRADVERLFAIEPG